MRHSLFKTTVMVAALLSAPVFAQAPVTPSPLPKSTPAEKVAPPASLNITEQKLGQWRSSKLIGLNVYNATDEKIGDISEVLLGQNGNVDAIIIGVGGFLGVGQHDVAVPFDEVRFIEQPAMRTSAAPANPQSAPGVAPAPADRTATTGAIATNSGSSTTGLPRAYPDHAVVNLTRDQLKAAPEFKYGR